MPPLDTIDTPPVAARDDLLGHELREPAAAVDARCLRYRVAASPNPSFIHAVVDTADHDRPLAFYYTHAWALARAARWNEKGHPAAARVEGQREPSARSPELLGATQEQSLMPEFSGQEVARIAEQIDTIYGQVARLRSLESKLRPNYNMGHETKPFTVRDAVEELYNAVRALAAHYGIGL
jgi:hypothetical protein